MYGRSEKKVYPVNGVCGSALFCRTIIRLLRFIGIMGNYGRGNVKEALESLSQPIYINGNLLFAYEKSFMEGIATSGLKGSLKSGG